MKRGATLLMALLLLATLILPASAQEEKLLYPAIQIQDDFVYCFAAPLEGGSISVTANGTGIDCTPSSLAQSGLGITYYCVVGITSSLSDIQKEQERLALTALNEALGEKDSLVLVSMNREIQFGEKLTDAASREAAIESFLTYPSFGTNLFNGIDTVLSTIAESETGACCVVFITDGFDNAGLVKVTEEQAGRFIQNSGLSVNFIGAMMPPYAMNNQPIRSQRLEDYAAMSLGGICRIPLRDEPNDYNAAAEAAGKEIVSQCANWTVIRLDAASLPRDQKTIDLTVTWTGDGNTLSDTIQIDTSDLPALPKPTTPPTEPETLPPATQPTVPLPTEPPVTEPIPQYQDDGAARNLWYISIGLAVVVVILVLVLVILATRKSISPATPQPREKRPERSPGKDRPAAPQEQQAPPMPGEDASMPPIRLPEDPGFSISLELPDEPQETPDVQETHELQAPQEDMPLIDISVMTEEKSPAQADEPGDDTAAMLDALYAELSLLPELEKQDTQQKPVQKPQQMEKAQPLTQAKPPRERPLNRRAAPQPEPEIPPAPPVEPIAPAPITPGVPTCTISLTPEGDPDGAVKIIMEANGSCTLGRNQKADVILNETDSALSGLHFELQWDGRVLHLTDRGSTNGTSLSGIPQRPGHWSRVESGTTVQAGSVRYKIQIQKN